MRSQGYCGDGSGLSGLHCVCFNGRGQSVKGLESRLGCRGNKSWPLAPGERRAAPQLSQGLASQK